MRPAGYLDQLSLGNIGRAYRFFFESSDANNRHALCDAVDNFTHIISCGAYHSAVVCREIRERFLNSRLPVPLKNCLRGMMIPEPCHPGIAFPCVDCAGTGALLYVATARDADRVMSHPHRYKVKPGLLQNLFASIGGYIADRYLSITPYQDAIVYRLAILCRANSDTSSFKLNGDGSASLAAAMALAESTGKSKYSSLSGASPTQIASADWDGDRFLEPASMDWKIRLIADELPDVRFVCTGISRHDKDCEYPVEIRRFASMDALFHQIDRSHPDFLERYLARIQLIIAGSGIGRHWAGLMQLIRLYPPGEIPITGQYEHDEKLLDILLLLFNSFHYGFWLEEALILAGRISEVFAKHENKFTESQQMFNVRKAVINTALYRFDVARLYRTGIFIDDLGKGDRSLYLCLQAECAMLAAEHIIARSFLNEAKSILIEKHAVRHELYCQRLILNAWCAERSTQNFTADPDIQCEGPDTVIECLYSKRSDMDSKNLPYWYYVTIRALRLSDQHEVAVSLAREAEMLYASKPYLDVWPGILWRRDGARSARALGDTGTALQWLEKPLPGALADRMILQVHAAVSRAMALVIRREAGDGIVAEDEPGQVVEPLLHPAVSDRFQSRVTEWIEAWRCRAGIDILWTIAEAMARDSYE